MVIHTDIYFVITVKKRAYRQSRSRKTLTKLFSKEERQNENPDLYLFFKQKRR